MEKNCNSDLHWFFFVDIWDDDLGEWHRCVRQRCVSVLVHKHGLLCWEQSLLLRHGLELRVVVLLLAVWLHSVLASAWECGCGAWWYVGGVIYSILVVNVRGCLSFLFCG